MQTDFFCSCNVTEYQIPQYTQINSYEILVNWLNLTKILEPIAYPIIILYRRAHNTVHYQIIKDNHTYAKNSQDTDVLSNSAYINILEVMKDSMVISLSLGLFLNYRG